MKNNKVIKLGEYTHTLEELYAMCGIIKNDNNPYNWSKYAIGVSCKECNGTKYYTQVGLDKVKFNYEHRARSKSTCMSNAHMSEEQWQDELPTLKNKIMLIRDDLVKYEGYNYLMNKYAPSDTKLHFDRVDAKPIQPNDDRQLTIDNNSAYNHDLDRQVERENDEITIARARIRALEIDIKRHQDNIKVWQGLKK